MLKSKQLPFSLNPNTELSTFSTKFTARPLKLFSFDDVKAQWGQPCPEDCLLINIFISMVSKQCFTLVVSMTSRVVVPEVRNTSMLLSCSW